MSCAPSSTATRRGWEAPTLSDKGPPDGSGSLPPPHDSAARQPALDFRRCPGAQVSWKGTKAMRFLIPASIAATTALLAASNAYGEPAPGAAAASASSGRQCI